MAGSKINRSSIICSGLFYFWGFFFCIPSAKIRSGEATNIDEYVPTAIPVIRTSENIFVASGPKKYRAKSTIITVSEVLIERANDCDKLLPTISSKLLEIFSLKFSRIRSKTTIVSEIEIPRMVKIATTNSVSISAPV